MSAEYLRETAAMIRKTAKAATPGPWEPWGHAEPEPGCRCMSCYQPSWAWEVDRIDGPECQDHDDCSHVMRLRYEDAEHIAKWHPGVALAAADLLDGLASDESWDFRHDEALAVARAWRGDA